ncbi:hypothetical protein EGW08_014045 [Elysia chlorotica]|uniref:G-protein coupled receptors family 1 profile domain-containing protein n=1 Tax=Elysia chlorotica TaxID=188477 RepID=A0A3S1HF98_ELYCH|nr:hypothetical protein EGW08_014045 [Elysia chlorotica]
MLNFSKLSTYLKNESSLVQQIVPIPLRNLFLKINCSVLLLFALAGIPNNILNILIFRKLGFNSNINIHFLFLSTIDLICAIIYACVAVIMLDMSGLIRLPVDLADAIYLTAIVLISLSTIGSWVTAIISVERCCSVVMPVKVKHIFTRKVTICLNAGMVIFQMAIITVNVTSLKFRVNKPLNDGRLQVILVYSDDSLYIALLFWGASLITFICMATVVVSTAFLGTALRQRERWLESLPFSANLSTRVNNRKVARTVVAISSIYITCSIPGVVVLLVLFAVPTLNPFAPAAESLSMVLSTFIQSFLAFSGMANIFVYLNMNSKYKEYFKNLLCFVCAQSRMRYGSDCS